MNNYAFNKQDNYHFFIPSNKITHFIYLFDRTSLKTTF